MCTGEKIRWLFDLVGQKYDGEWRSCAAKMRFSKIVCQTKCKCRGCAPLAIFRGVDQVRLVRVEVDEPNTTPSNYFV